MLMKKHSMRYAIGHFSSVVHHPPPRMDVLSLVVTNSRWSTSWSTKLMFYDLPSSSKVDLDQCAYARQTWWLQGSNKQVLLVPNPRFKMDTLKCFCTIFIEIRK